MRTPKKALKRFKREISPKFDVTHNKKVSTCNLSCHPGLLLQETFKRNEPSQDNFLRPVPKFEL